MTPTRPSAAKRWIWTGLRLILAATLLFYLGTSGAIDWSAVGGLTGTVWLLPVLTLLALFGAVTEGTRLSLILRSQGIRIRVLDGLRLVLIAMFFGIVLPGGTGGDVMKLFYLAAGNKGRTVEIATLLLADRVIAMLMLLLLVCLFGLFNLDLLRTQATLAVLVIIAAAVLVGVLVVAAAISSARVRESRLYAFVTERMPLGAWIDRGAQALRLLRGHRVAVAGTAGVALISQLAMAGTFVLIAAVMIPDVPVLITPLLSMLGLFANVVPITPGGLGVGEAAFDQLFRLVGYPGAAILMLAWRIALLPLYGTGCILYILGGRMHR